jgi:hypothetical protein
MEVKDPLARRYYKAIQNIIEEENKIVKMLKELDK